jgi:hypothetical protein
VWKNEFFDGTAAGAYIYHCGLKFKVLSLCVDRNRTIFMRVLRRTLIDLVFPDVFSF